MKNILAAFVLLMGFTANAGDGVEYRIHHHYQSPRALGMGDAFVAVADDYAALFYNPAGLARREDGQINMSMEFAGAKSFFDFADGVTKASDTQGTDSEKQEAMFDFLDSQYGKHFGLRTELFSGIWVRPNWGIGIIPLDFSLNMDVHNLVGPAVNITAYSDTTIAYGYGKDVKWIAGGRNSAGITVKAIHRGYTSKSVAAFELVENSEVFQPDDLKEGLTVDADFGFLYTPELPSEGFFSLLKLAKPTFGLVARNLLDLGFTQDLNLYNKEDTGSPPKMGRVLDIGTKWEYPELWIFGGRGTMDIRDIGHKNFNLRKGFHLGFEFDWTVASWWKGQYRVGINQGFLTAGFSALFAFFNLDLVTYSEDVGTFSTPKENRMYMAKFNMDF